MVEKNKRHVAKDKQKSDQEKKIKRVDSKGRNNFKRNLRRFVKGEISEEDLYSDEE
jgi:uncharacterized protein (DUF1786 family)